MRSLVDKVNRLKNKLTRELQVTVSYLRYHFNRRDVFDKKMTAHHMYHHRDGYPLDGDFEARELMDQKPLKEFGKVERNIQNENFEEVKKPSI